MQIGWITGDLRGLLRHVVWVLLALCVAAVPGCATRPPNRMRNVTVEQVEELRNMESLLPIQPDSVIARYRRNDPDTFYRTYGNRIAMISRTIDSLNLRYPLASGIDTLAIDHSFEAIGEAGIGGRTLWISSSYFYMFDDDQVLRSLTIHEYGHVLFRSLSPEEAEDVHSVWWDLSESALTYLFHDGEYSGNAHFGGHPGDSPAELFASSFNLLNTRREEFTVRIQYVDAKHYPLIQRLDSLVFSAVSRLGMPK